MDSVLQRCSSSVQVAAKAKDAIVNVASFLQFASKDSQVEDLLAVKASLESAQEMMPSQDLPGGLSDAVGVVADLVNRFGNTALERYAEMVADAVQARKSVLDGEPLFLGLWKLMRSYALTDNKAVLFG